jgi:hypothetical protein
MAESADIVGGESRMNQALRLSALRRMARLTARGGILAVSLVWAGCATTGAAPSAAREVALKSPDLTEADLEVGYVCPMHPDHTSDQAGQCPICGMQLVLGKPWDMRDYRLDVTTSPAVPVAGERVTLTLGVRHPDTGEIVREFEIVHDMPYHLFVISQDMEFFRHIHPEQGEDGVWSISVVLPKPGAYAILSDFVPKGGSAQFLARPLVTAGYDGDVLAQRAQLVPDVSTVQTVGPLRAHVTYDPPIMRAGSYSHIRLSITTADDDKPVRELEPYLGAFGHMLIMDEQMFDYVHSHPTENPTANIPLAEQRGGPDVTFEGLMPTPGMFRAWAQVKYRGEVYTFTNTFEVLDVGVTR